ncbi:MAG: SUMF1/EgtB/PvdO family nonheme iron enzyme [Deltaproteobacteria bacterium]|nr:SUMF1/EgtB/PvdO family nonheme iron enzyme [Deltaproteobacteria bacterium]
MKRLTLALVFALLMVLAAAPCSSAGPKIVAEENIVGQIRVLCNVSEATVTLAGFSFQTQVGKAIIIGDVPAGPQEVKATKEGYADWSGQIVVQPKATVDLVIKMTALQTEKKEEAQTSQPAQAAEEEASTPTAETVPVKSRQADKIEELLTAAEADINALRLTSPAKNNAWDKYRQVLALDFENQEAKQGLSRIVDVYITLAQKAVDRGEPDKAVRALDKADKVIPGDERIEAARNRLKAKTAPPEPKPQPKAEEKDKTELPKTVVNSIAMKLVLCPAGSFMMGSGPSEGFADERPARKVTFSKPFYIGVYEVTQLEYQRIMGENPSNYRETAEDFKGKLTRPVERVDWNSASKFCSRLSGLEGKTYRLPTEAEWEYACRAGGDPLGPIGIQGPETKASGQTSNAWGIYDMQGNVWEWCSDWYSPTYYSSGQDVDPQGPDEGSKKVARGGSFISEDKDRGSTRSNQRRCFAPHVRDKTLGFRVVLEP